MLTLYSFPNQKIGQTHKSQSDMIMEKTWNNDIASKVAYIYDFFQDTHINQMTDLYPIDDEYKIPVDIKFLKNASQIFDKDFVTFHIQFKPSFNYVNSGFEYYDKLYKNIYNSIFPVGLYIDIPDESGRFNKWMVVNTANYYVNQFPTYEVLPINYVIQYIIDNKKYQVPVVLRSQNS